MANLVCLAMPFHPVKSVDCATVRRTTEFPLLFSSLEGALSLQPAKAFHIGRNAARRPVRSSHRYGAFIMPGFYEELADFAAMSEDDGFLGQCASEAADSLASAEVNRTTSISGGGHSHARPRQLRLLVIGKETYFSHEDR
jgi:hypothetical protein